MTVGLGLQEARVVHTAGPAEGFLCPEPHAEHCRDFLFHNPQLQKSHAVTDALFTGEETEALQYTARGGKVGI